MNRKRQWAERDDRTHEVLSTYRWPWRWFVAAVFASQDRKSKRWERIEDDRRDHLTTDERQQEDANAFASMRRRHDKAKESFKE